MQTSISASDFTERQLLSAEILALVVCRLFPNVILMGGGTDSLGFHYDFVFEQSLAPNMLELIEVEMHRFAKEKKPVRSVSMMRENAQALFEHQAHFMLAERAGHTSSNILDLVEIDHFYGLCPPLSLTETSAMGSVKLLEKMELTQMVEGEKVVVTRLKGISQQSGRDLKHFLKNYESFLKKKDHRLLGPQLNLFSFSESMNFLGVIWHSKGLQLQRFLFSWLTTQLCEEVDPISTPLVALQHFLGPDSQAFNSFQVEGKEYRLRSSLLPQHLAFLRQYRPIKSELPKKIQECTLFFRHIPEALRWGLFSQSSALGEETTICCLKEQVVAELISSLHFIEQIITIFGFKGQWYLIASRQKMARMGQNQEAMHWLKQAIQAHPCLFPCSSEIEEKEGEKGVCLELRVQDVLGREWPLSRMSVSPSGEGISPVDEPGEKCVVFTRQIWESLDRLIALLIEQNEGNFPFWLAPEQVRVLAIGEASQEYARQINRCLRQAGLRTQLDLRQSKLGMRVHEAEKEHIPYLVLVGEQERVKQTISVRTYGKFNQSQSIDVATFLTRINQMSQCPRINREKEIA